MFGWAMMTDDMCMMRVGVNVSTVSDCEWCKVARTNEVPAVLGVASRRLFGS